MTDDRLTRPAKIAGTISAFATRSIERGDAIASLVALGLSEQRAKEAIDNLEAKLLGIPRPFVSQQEIDACSP